MKKLKVLIKFHNSINCRTLTAPVKLNKCLEAIKTYAFVASEYPVILTLEDHLTPDLQAKVAKVIYQPKIPHHTLKLIILIYE